MQSFLRKMNENVHIVSSGRQQNRSTRFLPQRHQQMTQFRSMDRMPVALDVDNLQMSQDNPAVMVWSMNGSRCYCQTPTNNVKVISLAPVDLERTLFVQPDFLLLMKNVCHTHSFPRRASMQINCKNGIARKLYLMQADSSSYRVVFGSARNKREN